MKKLELENRIRGMSPCELQNLAATSQLIGQVIFASSFIEPITSGNFGTKGITTGLLLSATFFIASFLLAKKADSKI
jgi:hypothetical protein